MQTGFLFAVALMKTSRNEVTNAQVYHINYNFFNGLIGLVSSVQLQ